MPEDDLFPLLPELPEPNMVFLVSLLLLETTHVWLLRLSVARTRFCQELDRASSLPPLLKQILSSPRSRLSCSREGWAEAEELAKQGGSSRGKPEVTRRAFSWF